MREEWLRKLVETSPDMIVAVDARGRIAWANAQAAELTGVPVAELVGTSVERLLPAELAERHGALREGYGARPLPRRMGESRVLRMRRADGGERFVEVSLTPLADGDSSVVIATVRDVSARIDAERRQDAMLRELITRTPSLVMVVREGRVVFANARFATLLGRPVEALVGRGIDELVGSASLVPMVLDPTRTALEVTLACDDGSAVRVEMEPPVTVVLEGAPAQMIVAVDRTELLRLREGAQLAERLIAESVLAAGVTHELAAPLQALTSFVELARTSRGAELEEVLADAQDAVQHIAGVVSELRAAGRVGPEGSAETDLRRAVEAAFRLARAPLRHAAARVELNVPAVRVRADRGRLTQVLANLLVNAAHAVRERGAERLVVVRATTSAREGDDIEVSVSDTGIGIPASVLPKVFDPYYTTRATHGGTGLGLSICRTLVRAMGGDIAIESTPGAGTTVRVRLLGAVSRP